MRLTLRTMLAYMDDILEPDDAADIRQKIEASEFASGLLRRTRECVGRLRLGAPPLAGKGMALDANTVAEYLDNTLASARVPDFEKVCLESDMHLAEVAACHQILTLVLGEPAQIDPAAREHMYRLGYRHDEAHAAQPAPAPAAAASVAEVAVPPRARPEVPEYLRASRSRLWSSAAALVVALAVGLVTFGLLALFGPEKVQKKLLALLGKQPVQNEEPERNPPPEGDSQNPAEGGRATSSGADAASEAPAAASAHAATDGVDEAIDVPPIPPEPGDTDAAAAALQPGEAMDGADTVDEAPTDALDQPTATADDAASPAAAATGDEENLPPTPRANGEEAAAAGGLGRYFSEQDVLLRWDRAGSAWRRLPKRASVAAGDRLLALPGFRPRVTLGSGIDLQAAGAAQFTLAPPDADDVPGVVLEDGRLLLATAGRPQAQVRVRVGDRTGTVTFGDAESSAALEVRSLTVPGQDPRLGLSPTAVELFVTSGAVDWEERGQSLHLVGPAAKSLTPELAADTPLDRFPKWIAAESLTATERLGAKTIEQALAEDRPISLVLKELAEHRKVEVRSLAARSAAYVGQYDLLLAGLSDLEQRSADSRFGWPAFVELLRSAVARSPQSAKEVAAAFDKLRGEDGSKLFRMLWGYTPEQLRQGEAERLVEYLNHDSLDYRELAFWNLQSITGVTLAYRPHDKAKERAPMVRKWRERAKDGKIAPAEKQPADKSAGAES